MIRHRLLAPAAMQKITGEIHKGNGFACEEPLTPELVRNTTYHASDVTCLICIIRMKNYLNHKPTPQQAKIIGEAIREREMK